MSNQLHLDAPDGAPQPGSRVESYEGRARQQPAQVDGPPDLAPGGKDVHLLDYVKVIYKRRGTALTAFLLVAGSVVVYTFTATPIFEARTRLLIESDERNVVSFKQVVQEDQTKADYYQTQYNILQSRVLARKTLDTLKLWDHPLFGGGPQPEKFSVKGSLAVAARAVAGRS